MEVLDGAASARCAAPRTTATQPGVICAKVARYAERIHHPDRLTQPLLRTGPKGSGAVPADLLGRGARPCRGRFAARCGEAWLRGGVAVLLCRHDGAGAARRHQPAAPRDALFAAEADDLHVACRKLGWLAGVGPSRGVDPREMAKSDLIVVWGGNPVSTQVNVMTHISRARKERGAKLVVVDPYRTRHRRGRRHASGAAARHRRRAGLRGDACAFRDGYADRDYLARYTDCPDELEAHLRSRGPDWAAAITGLPVAADRGFRAALRHDAAQLHPLRLRLRAHAQRRGEHARGDLPAGRHRRLAIRRRRRAVVQPRHVPLGQDADRRPGRARSQRSACWT